MWSWNCFISDLSPPLWSEHSDKGSLLCTDHVWSWFSVSFLQLLKINMDQSNMCWTFMEKLLFRTNRKENCIQQLLRKPVTRFSTVWLRFRLNVNMWQFSFTSVVFTSGFRSSVTSSWTCLDPMFPPLISVCVCSCRRKLLQTHTHLFVVVYQSVCALIKACTCRSVLFPLLFKCNIKDELRILIW